MATFCDECNKPIANTPEAKKLAVYCQCVPYKKEKGERQVAKVSVDSRPPITNREQRKEVEINENARIDNLGVVAETEAEDKRNEENVDYMKVLDDLMTRYTEIGISIIAIRRILREQGKDPDA